MCSRTDCDVEPEWRPVIVVRARGFEKHPIRCVIGVGLCGFCKPKTKLADLLTDGMWQNIVDGLARMGKLAPTRDLTTLDFCGIKSKESRALVEQRPS